MIFNELIDIKENNILKVDYELLDILLKDMTTGKNILWGTDNYLEYGQSYNPKCEIKIEQITSINGNIIKPRTKKNKEEKNRRIREKAEVFTPSWVCNHQNNLVDNEWFKKENLFNIEKEKGWKTKKAKINFNKINKNWEEYVTSIRLEITCGEAPYIVSRYDTTNGDVMSVIDRIGMLDRKLRIVNENVNDEAEWYLWVQNAYKSIYGFEWQGDSLLIARENLLYTFSDNYKYKFNKKPSLEQLKEIATIISWNLFQMDGTKFVIPYSCSNEDIVNYTIFGEEIEKNECPGCKNSNFKTHNGKYVKIMNWKTKRKIKFISLLNKKEGN